MTEAKVTKTAPDSMGNDQFTVEIDGNRVGTVGHIKRENITYFSSYMTANRSWVIAGLSGIHFTSRAHAVESLTNKFTR